MKSSTWYKWVWLNKTFEILSSDKYWIKDQKQFYLSNTSFQIILKTISILKLPL